jgi:hypothetical protein
LDEWVTLTCSQKQKKNRQLSLKGMMNKKQGQFLGKNNWPPIASSSWKMAFHEMELNVFSRSTYSTTKSRWTSKKA